MNFGPESGRLEREPFPEDPESEILKKFINACRPRTSRYWRLLLAGMVWLVVGISLITAACYWLSSSPWPFSLVLAAVSFGSGLTVYRFGFSRVASRNIARLESQSEPACLFSFQGPYSYFLIIVMIALGYTLRHLPFPKSIDAFVYFTMGSGLALGSSLYFEAFMED